jgi:hypothetical protein
MPAGQALAVTRYVVTSMVTALIGDTVTPREWLPWIDTTIDPADLADLADDDIEDRLRDLAIRRDPHRLLLAAMAVESERSLERPAVWRPASLAYLLPWLDLLVGLGWEASTWEQDRIDAARGGAEGL